MTEAKIMKVAIRLAMELLMAGIVQEDMSKGPQVVIPSVGMD